jgi:DNA-binding transcriptional ArsR family regulator
MPPAEPIERWIKFFKALADENRLKIVGLLAHKPHSVEELAANLGVTSATVSHHLQKLQQADLVEARVLQYYNVYALRADILHEMAEQLASADFAQGTAPLLNLDAYTNWVLDEYWVRGKLKALPTQIKKREVILRRLAQEFEPGRRYTEKRVNEILKPFYADVDTLRRELVNCKLLKQEHGFYWKVASSK